MQPLLSLIKLTNYMYGEKIKTIRELRGFSQEYMADKLGIAQNTYSKIETGQTNLKIDTLIKLAEILGVSPMDIVSNQPAIINFESNHGTKQGIAHVEHFYIYQREFVEKMVASKDSEIQHLKEIISGLLKDKDSMMNFLRDNYKTLLTECIVCVRLRLSLFTIPSLSIVSILTLPDA